MNTRIFGSLLLVQLYTPARPAVQINVSAFLFRATRKNFLKFRAEAAPFLDAEIRYRQIQMNVSRVPHRRDIARPVPGGTHAELLAEPRQLFEASFQLSFFVMLIIALMLLTYESFHKKGMSDSGPARLDKIAGVELADIERNLPH